MILHQLGIIERDSLSIHLNGDNDSSISANILFPQGITIPDAGFSTSPALIIGDASGSPAGNGVVQFYLTDFGSGSGLRYLSMWATSDTLGAGTGYSFHAGNTNVVDGVAGFGEFVGGSVSSPGTGSGGDFLFGGGAGRGAGYSGGRVRFQGGTGTSSATYGYVSLDFAGSPNKLPLTGISAITSMYIESNLEVDGTTWLDGNALVGGTLNVTGATTLATSLTGIGKLTAGLVGVASSADILAAVDFGTVMLKSDDGTTTYYKPATDDDAGRGDALEAAIAAHTDGDLIYIGPGDYELNASFTPATGSSFIGVGQPKLYASSLSNALIILSNSDTTIQNLDLETDFVGLGAIQKDVLNVSGIRIINVTHVPLAGETTDVSGLQFSESIGGGTTEHIVQIDVWDSKFYGGTTTGYGVHMGLDDGSVVNLWNCDVYGSTDGILNKNVGGVSAGVTNIYGGKYASTLDAITSGGTGNIINVYGATARGDQADIYGDDGTVNVHWTDARTDYIVGNGVNQSQVENVVGNLNLIAGQLTYVTYGGAIDAGLRRIAASTLQVTNGSSTRADLEVADEAYNASTWNGSFEVPTKNAVRDLAVTLQPLDATLTAFAAYNTAGLLTQTAADTFTGRTITGTTNQVNVSNGNGVSGNPTLSLPQNVHTAATPTFASLTLTGNLTVDTNTIITDATNNTVGIGIAAVAGAGKLKVGGAIYCATESGAFGTSSPYAALIVDGGAAGGLYGCGRANPASIPFVGMSGYDSGSSNQIYYGGGGWSVPDANEHLFYAAPTYTETPDTGVLQLTINSSGCRFDNDVTFVDAQNVILNTTTGTKLGTATTQKLGFWNATPVVRPSAYTQTYSTADKTLSAYTSNPESSSYTGIDNLQVGSVYATVADLNALRVAYENLRTFAEDAVAMLNSVVDDLQTVGIVG